jgi:hypothetical protein
MSINKMDKNSYDDIEKDFDKIQHLFMMKTLKLGMGGNFLKLVFTISKTPQLTVLNESLISGMRTVCSLLPL